MVMYEWYPFGQTKPRRLPFWKILLNHLETNWPTEYRDTTATEGIEGSEHVIMPFVLKDDIGWGVSYKHFNSAKKVSTIAAYIDDKYNDYTEDRYSRGARKTRTYVCVDMAYRYTTSITSMDGDTFPLQYEGNKIMIDNILSDCAALEPYGVHYIWKGRTVSDARFSDEEIFLERISRDLDEKALASQNDMYWIYRKIYKVEVFDGIKLY